MATTTTTTSSSWIETLRALDPKAFVSSFIVKDTRPDGRPFSMCRPTHISTDILQKHTAGSALVKLGDTQVLCGVVLKVGVPNTADTGDIQCDNDPNLEQLLMSVLNLKCLLIEPGKAAWRLQISWQILNDDGNCDDAKVLAAVAALRNTILPPVQLITNNATTKTNGIVEIQDDNGITKGKPLEFTTCPVPLTVGLCSLANHQGDSKGKNDNTLLIADPTVEEQVVLDGTLTIIVDAMNDSKDILYLRHSGMMGIGRKELAVSAHMAYERAKELDEILYAGNKDK